MGAEGEIESVDIPRGTITVTAEDKTQAFSVVGDAGFFVEQRILCKASYLCKFILSLLPLYY